MANILFDLDGTLIESLTSICRAGNRLLVDLGRGPVSEADYSGFVGRGTAAQLRDALAFTGGVPEDWETALLPRLKRYYLEDPVSGTIVFDGVSEALEGLRGEGHALAVVTQKPGPPTGAILRAFGLEGHFNTVTSGDSHPFLKPDPRMIHETVALMPAGPVIFVGDSAVDMATARAAGVPFVMRAGGYGLGADMGEADAVFDGFAELPEIVSGLTESV